MHPFITDSRSAVADYLRHYLTGEAPAFMSFRPWGPDVLERLTEYALRGKLIRGSLVGMGYRLFSEGPPPVACTQVGAAMELMQSFLLVHDDIMDQDDTRRGGPAVHAQYAGKAPVPDESRKAHYGLSLGICAGDVAALLAFDLVAGMEAPAETALRISRLMAREIALTGLAQMQDVHHGYLDQADDSAIMAVYTYKTGRYTFSLPLVCGAILAGADDRQQSELAAMGEALGRIFQIRDDRLGLFGSAEQTGKPEASDVRENKQTPYRSAALRRMPEDDPLRQVFGSSTAGPEDIERLRRRIVELGADDEVEKLVEADSTLVREAISRLALRSQAEEALRALLDYNLQRRV